MQVKPGMFPTYLDAIAFVVFVAFLALALCGVVETVAVALTWLRVL